jgi:hypothetical protein
LEKLNQVRIHVVVFIGDIEDGDFFTTELRAKFSIETIEVVFLHDEDKISPVDLLFGQGDDGVVIESGGIDFDARLIAKNGFGGGTAQFVLRAEKENFSQGAVVSFLRFRHRRVGG